MKIYHTYVFEVFYFSYLRFISIGQKNQIKTCLSKPYSAPSLFKVLLFMVIWPNISTVNYEDRLNWLIKPWISTFKMMENACINRPWQLGFKVKMDQRKFICKKFVHWVRDSSLNCIVGNWCDRNRIGPSSCRGRWPSWRRWCRGRRRCWGRRGFESLDGRKSPCSRACRCCKWNNQYHGHICCQFHQHFMSSFCANRSMRIL